MENFHNRKNRIALFFLSLWMTNHMAFGLPPEWSKDAIWYQIFPERFNNGDRSNDPTKETLLGTWPFEPVKSWKISPWKSDWYKMQPWESANGMGFYYNAQRRRYGGDIQGILTKLDYLKKIGITAIYLNPIFESPSLHKYGATMFHHIDNNFGPDPRGDEKIWRNEDPSSPKTWQWTSADKLFLKLIKECHRRNIKIIIDGVFNHVGINFWALQKAKVQGPSSKYADWFDITEWDDPNTPEDEFKYKGWAGFKGLPVFKHGKTGPMAAVKEHFRSVIKRWMDPNADGDPSDGIDGWRLDVAAEVPIGFWKEFRHWTKSINPNAYLTGEIWWKDYKNNELKNAKSWLVGDTFDAVMNYRFADTAYQFFNQSNDPLSPSAFTQEMYQIHKDYGYDVCLGLQNLLGSHDTQRLASMIKNPEHRLDHGANLKQNRGYSINPVNPENQRKLMQIVAFQFFSPGAPFIYYGDEVGMWGADDPDCRKPMIWPEINHENEIATPFGEPRQNENRVEQNVNLLEFYTQLCLIRKKFIALRRGDFKVILMDNKKRLIGFKRTYKNSVCVAIFNASNITVKMPILGKDLNFSMGSEKTTLNKLSNHGFALFIN